jgi:hypothetical protein
MAPNDVRVFCPETQRQTWLPAHLLAGLAGVGEQTTWLADRQVEELRAGVVGRLANSEDDEAWHLRQVVAVLDDGLSERAAIGVDPDGDFGVHRSVRPGATAEVDAVGMADGLHDAWIDFDSLGLKATGFHFSGYFEEYRERFRYDAVLPAATHFDLIDEARIGGTTIGDVSFDGRALIIEGNFPSRLAIQTNSDTTRVRVNVMPFAHRRWFKWRDIEDSVAG